MKTWLTIVTSLLLGLLVTAVHTSQSSGKAGGSPKPSGCSSQGWRQVHLEIGGQKRRLLYKGPPGAWENGAILVLHGGGGKAEDFCEQGNRLLAPQVAFAQTAIDQKFAVLLLDSTQIVTDRQGMVCGKIWDDEVRERVNIDLPYLDEILRQVVPSLRPPGSNLSMFMAGHSSGGYMTVRAASHMGHRLDAIAAIASGDPYGWTRRCNPAYGDKRENVKGAGFDNETGKQIIEVGACLGEPSAKERMWDHFEGRKPVFRIFHNEFDGINDISCGRKVDRQLRANGFTGEQPYLAKRHDGRRRLIYHFWANEYNLEILAFFRRSSAER